MQEKNEIFGKFPAEKDTILKNLLILQVIGGIMDLGENHNINLEERKL